MMTKELRQLLSESGWSMERYTGGISWQKRIDFVGGDVIVTWEPWLDVVAVRYVASNASAEQVEKAYVVMSQVREAAGMIRIVDQQQGAVA